MTDPTSEFFRILQRRGHEPLLERFAGTLAFRLTGDARTERWLVHVDRGELSVSRGRGPADCVVSADKAVFGALVVGRANALTALLRGELSVEGDPELMVAFQRILPLDGRLAAR